MNIFLGAINSTEIALLNKKLKSLFNQFKKAEKKYEQSGLYSDANKLDKIAVQIAIISGKLERLER